MPAPPHGLIQPAKPQLPTLQHQTDSEIPRSPKKLLARRTHLTFRDRMERTIPGIRYAPGYNGGPPNDGLPPGIFFNPNTGRRYILPETPRADGSNGPPNTSQIFPIYEYNGPTSPLGPATYLKSEYDPSKSIRVSGPYSDSGSGSGFQHGSGSPSDQIAETRMILARPSNRTAETRMTLVQDGRVHTRPIYQPSEDNNDIDEPD